MTLLSILLFPLYEDTESLGLSNLPRATQLGGSRAGLRVPGCLALNLTSFLPWVRGLWPHQWATGQELAGVAVRFDAGVRKLFFFFVAVALLIHASDCLSMYW